MNEEWKDIPGYEGLYQVSNLGRVKSLARQYQTGAHNVTISLPEVILKTKVRRTGYSLVTLNKDGVPKDAYVHRLVAQNFLANDDNLPYVNHKDGNPRNNHVENLEWCTPQYNTRYNDAHIRGGKNRRVPIIQKTFDGKIVRKWDSAAEAGEKYGKSGARNINNCLRFSNRETAYGFIWEYAK